MLRILPSKRGLPTRHELSLLEYFKTNRLKLQSVQNIRVPNEQSILWHVYLKFRWVAYKNISIYAYYSNRKAKVVQSFSNIKTIRIAFYFTLGNNTMG